MLILFSSFIMARTKQKLKRGHQDNENNDQKGAAKGGSAENKKGTQENDLEIESIEEPALTCSSCDSQLKADKSYFHCSSCKQNKENEYENLQTEQNLNFCEGCIFPHVKKGHSILDEAGYKVATCDKHKVIFSSFCESCGVQVCVPKDLFF